MASAELRLDGALQGLSPLGLDHLPGLRDAVIAGGQIGFAYCFPRLLAYQRPGRCSVLIGEDDGSVCLYRWRATAGQAPLVDVLTAPAPMHPPALHRCLERANDFNRDRRARVLRIDARDADAVAALPGLALKPHRTQYLYSPAAFGDLAGRKYRTVRRNVLRVQSLPDLTLMPFEQSHTPACLALLQRWRNHHRQVHGSSGGAGTARRLIHIADALAGTGHMTGELIWIGGELAGFAFGGEIHPGVGAFIEAKNDHTVAGLGFFQRYSFLSQLPYEIVNDGGDVGRAGLAQLKNSLRPVELHVEHRATQRQAGD